MIHDLLGVGLDDVVDQTVHRAIALGRAEPKARRGVHDEREARRRKRLTQGAGVPRRQARIAEHARGRRVDLNVRKTGRLEGLQQVHGGPPLVRNGDSEAPVEGREDVPWLIRRYRLVEGATRLKFGHCRQFSPRTGRFGCRSREWVVNNPLFAISPLLTYPRCLPHSP